MYKSDHFLRIYRECEGLVRVRFPEYEDSGMSPMLWLEDTVKSAELRMKLRSMREVRNVIAHNPMFLDGDLIIPGEGMMEFLDDLHERLSVRHTAERIMTRLKDIQKCTVESTVMDAVDFMLENKHWYIPVLKEGKLYKLFSVTDALSWMRKGHHETAFKTMRSEFGEVRFVRPTADEGILLRLLADEAPLLAVTEHGRPDEPLMGMITRSDMMRRVDL